MSDPVIDFHFGAPEDPQSGCYWSKEFEKGIAFLAMRLVTGSLFGKINIERVRNHILGVTNGSKYVHYVVLLAMDQVYDVNGNTRREIIHLYVPNSYIASVAKENNRTLLGASIHPYRTDWAEDLEYCLKNPAVLCKWIPSSQQIDLIHPKCIAFYKKLAEIRLPLLCHAGPEGAIPSFDKTSQDLNNPNLLRHALDAGVTVIAAHAALPLLPPPFESDEPYQALVSLFREADTNGWKHYADLSAINIGPRGQYVEKLKKDIPPERLLFGSDYPIPMLDTSQKPNLSIGHWLKHFFQTVAAKNPLDKNYLLIKNMDFGDALFTNASAVLRLG